MNNSEIKKPLIFIRALCLLFIFAFVWHSALQRPFISKAKTNQICTALSGQKNLFSTLFDGARLYLGGKYRSTWNEGVKPTKNQRKEQKKLFGYTLGIEHIIDNDPGVITNHKRPTLYLHGWGDIKNSAKLFKAYCDSLPGDIVSFKFRDSGIFFPKLRHSSLGQLPDILPALYTLKWTKDMLKPEAIDLYGYSRGGATTINMIAVLNDKTGIYDELLSSIGINANERIQLLELIQKGCIVLDCPLTDLNVSAKHVFKDFAPHALRTLATVGKYDLNGIQAIDSANKLEGLSLKILIHYQHNDQIVSNHNEAEFYRRIAKTNQKTTYMVLGNDGGHAHTHKALSKTIHTFKHMFGGSYDPVYDMHYKLYHAHESTCSDKLLQPGIRADSCISSFNAWCSAQVKNNRVNFVLFSITH